MSLKHTPGPWMYRRRTDKPPFNYYVHQEGEQGEPGTALVTIYDEGGGYIHEGNAALIAAAPDLLAACEEVLKAATDPDYDDYFDGARIEVMLERAIAKAKGSEQ